MAIPIRAIPVLEGAAARRFEHFREQAENQRGTVDMTEQHRSFQYIMRKSREKGYLYSN